MKNPTSDSTPIVPLPDAPLQLERSATPEAHFEKDCEALIAAGLEQESGFVMTVPGLDIGVASINVIITPAFIDADHVRCSMHYALEHSAKNLVVIP